MTSGFSVSWYASAVRVGVRMRLYGQGLCFSVWFWCSCSLPCAFVCGYAYLGKDCACLSVVLIRTLCSLLLFTGPDALHHGRYGPECLDGFLLVVHTPVVCNDICLWFRLQKTVQAPQLQYV